MKKVKYSKSLFIKFFFKFMLVLLYFRIILGQSIGIVTNNREAKVKQILICFPLSLIFFISSITSAQVRNIASMKGTWTGQWVNSYYQSTGSISVNITVDLVKQAAYGDWTVGGNVLGQSRVPFSTQITLTSTGFNASFSSSIWGDISGTGLYSGVYSGIAANCPNPYASNIAAAGSFNNKVINGTFTFVWSPAGSSPISGTVTIAKENPINDPTNLTVNENPPGTVNLKWTDNATNETGYRIERKDSTTGTWTQLTTLGVNSTAYSDKNVVPETQYAYRVTAYNTFTESEYSPEVSLKTVTSIEDNKTFIKDYLLLQNYPNPFNPSTVIRYAVPRESKVEISVYNILGNYVTTLKNNIQSQGQYEVKFDGSNLVSGVYIVKMIAQSVESGKKFADYKKMVMLK